MQRLSFYFATHNRYSEPVCDHDFLLRCVPQDLPEQQVLDWSLTVLPRPVESNPGKDSFGNVTYGARLPEAHDHLHYVVRGTAVRDDSLREPAPAMACYRFPSSLTQPSPLLEELATTVPQEGSPLEQAARLSLAVHDRMAYVASVTDVHTTATQALAQGKGVCQDFTNILLALCRMRGLTVRYVSGIPLGEGPSHAWGEVWQEGIWYGLDPTRACPANEGYLKLCCGRDFADCPIETGVFHGFASQDQEVFSRLEVV